MLESTLVTVLFTIPGLLCICVSSYSVNRPLNLLALKALHWWLCVWWLFVKKDTLEADENTQATSSCCFVWIGNYVYFYAQNALMQCILFLRSSFLRAHTQTALRIRTLSCFIVCVHHWMDCYITWALGTGGMKKKNNDSKELLWVSSLCRECVCRLHKFVQLLQREKKIKKKMFREEIGTV